MANQKYTLSADASLVLDLIRGVSAQMVVVGHLLAFLGVFPTDKSNALYIQNVGVLVFFMLSGFLISYATFNKLEKGYTFKLFFFDRFSRIYSGLLPSLLVVFVIDSIFIYLFRDKYEMTRNFNLKTFLANIFMLESVISTSIEKAFDNFLHIKNLRIEPFGTARPLWSLAVEWWIYMCFGWLVLGQKVFKNKFLYLLILAFLSYVPIINVLGGTGDGLSLVWLGGLILYVFLSKNILLSLPKKNAQLISFLVFILAILRLKINHYDAYDLVFAYLLLISLYFLMISLNNAVSLNGHFPFFSKIIKTIANYSFTLYLVHYSVCEFLLQFRGQYSDAQIFMAAMIISNILAYFVAYFTEMKHKDFNIFLKKHL